MVRLLSATYTSWVSKHWVNYVSIMKPTINHISSKQTSDEQPLSDELPISFLLVSMPLCSWLQSRKNYRSLAWTWQIDYHRDGHHHKIGKFSVFDCIQASLKIKFNFRSHELWSIRDIRRQTTTTTLPFFNSRNQWSSRAFSKPSAFQRREKPSLVTM